MFGALGYRSLWASEARWAEITREMFVSGDFFHPTIGGVPYFDKPLLTYWAIALFSAVAGRLDELIVRLPSALAALVALICTIILGRRLWSVRVGRLAGGLLLTSYGLLMYSRVASAETENLAAVMLAVVWYWSRRDRPGFVSFLVFYLIMAIGSHMKGLTAFVVPVLVVLPDLVRQRRWRWLLRPSHWLALGIGVAVYMAPFIYESLTRPESYQQSGLMLALRENIVRYVQPFDHKDPIYTYLWAVPLLVLPWVPIFVAALITAATTWKKLDSATRWLIEAILMIFAFFTLSGSRRDYYILPILPFCMLLMAVFLVQAGQVAVKHWERGLRLQKQALIVAAIAEMVVGPLAVWILVSKKHWDVPVSLGVSFFVVGLAVLLAGAVAYKVTGTILQDGRMRSAWTQIVMAAVLLGGFFTWQYNIFESRRTGKPFALSLNAAAQALPHDRVAFWHKYEGSVLFYMKWDPPITWLTDEAALRAFLENDQPGMVISEERYIPESVASMLPDKPTYVETAYSWESPEKRQKKMKAWLVSKDVSMAEGNGKDTTRAE
jgi:4-amino-4-deoxy-L-arabinose transferase-like glycosyltransferase